MNNTKYLDKFYEDWLKAIIERRNLNLLNYSCCLDSTYGTGIKTAKKYFEDVNLNHKLTRTVYRTDLGNIDII